MLAWSLVFSSQSLTLLLYPEYNALLPHIKYVRVFGFMLSPDHLRRGITRSVRYYAIFK